MSVALVRDAVRGDSVLLVSCEEEPLQLWLPPSPFLDNFSVADHLGAGEIRSQTSVVCSASKMASYQTERRIGPCRIIEPALLSTASTRCQLYPSPRAAENPLEAMVVRGGIPVRHCIHNKRNIVAVVLGATCCRLHAGTGRTAREKDL